MNLMKIDANESNKPSGTEINTCLQRWLVACFGLFECDVLCRADLMRG